MTVTVAMIGTLDTKAVEFTFLRECLTAGGVATITIDTGVLGEPNAPADISADQVAASGGADLIELRRARDRSRAIQTMARGAASIVGELYESGRIQGAICLGGGQGSTIGAAALHRLPVGVPKVIVSTIAGVEGAGSAIIGIRDTTLINSVIDISGLNSVSRTILANAAAAIAGMVTRPRDPLEQRRGLRVAETMFGVTTPCATRVRHYLEKAGFEVLVFAATGAGDRAMEDMISADHLDGVVDLTTSQLGQGVVRGDAPGGVDRLTVAGRRGIPQVVSLGGLDIVVCAAGDPLIAQAHAGARLQHQHSPVMTVVRPTPAESASIGSELARRLNLATGPTSVVIPRRGFSEYSIASGPLYDRAADDALISAFRQQVRPAVDVRELDTDINDPAFGDALASTYVHLAEASGQRPNREEPIYR